MGIACQLVEVGCTLAVLAAGALEAVVDVGTAFVAVAAAAAVGVAVAVAPAQPQVESEFRASRLRSPFLLAPRRANPELLFCLYKPPPSFSLIPAILCNFRESSPQTMLSSGSRGISFGIFQDVVARIAPSSVFRFGRGVPFRLFFSALRFSAA